MRRVYLDTNVHSYLFEADEARDARDYFRRSEVEVLVGDEVLLETLHIKESRIRRRRLKTLRTVGGTHVVPPTPYREAMEILAEVKRCRPRWLEPHPDESMVKKFLRINHSQWNDFKYDRLPEPTLVVAEYKLAAEPATKKSLDDQRIVRTHRREAGTLELRVDDAELQGYLNLFGQPERYWRISSMVVWRRALDGHPAMRDYKDFLGPYLRSTIDSREWAMFWIRDVRGEALQLGRLRSNMEFFQTTQKISHGNPIDAGHGVHLVDCNLFLTCDRVFFNVLESIVKEGVPGARLGSPALVARAAGKSALRAIRRVLEI